MPIHTHIPRPLAMLIASLAALLLVGCSSGGDGGGGGPSCDAACWSCKRACDRAQSCDVLGAGELAVCKRACDFDSFAMLDDSDNPECTDGCCVLPGRVMFRRAHVLGANRAVRGDDGVWRRLCDGGVADGVALDLVLVSTQRSRGASGPDPDLGIRPADVINWRVVGLGEPDDADVAGGVSVAIDAFTSLPSAGMGSTTSPDLGAPEIRFVENTASRGVGQDVIVLIDQSGSVSGLVDAERGYREAPLGDFVPPPNFGDLASDRANLRLSAARRLMRMLDERDRVGVVAFGEGVGLSAPCSLAQGDVEADLAACFGANLDVWLATNGMDSLVGQASGRSNLWQAVGLAVDWLGARGAEAPERGRHVVVFTDGPDTCSGEALGDCQAPCSDVTVAGVRAKVAALAATGASVRLHFVQFESLGYPGRDPRQIEAACASGGHHLYVNSLEFPRTQVQQLQEALEVAAASIRYGFGGHWTAGIPIPAWSAGAAPNDLEPGALYALSGELVVGARSRLVSIDLPYPFGVGQGAGAASAVDWDRRPSLRVECSAATDCGAAAEPDACTLICSPETLLCVGGSAGMAAPDLTACGDGAACCQGECVDSTQCGACD